MKMSSAFTLIELLVVVTIIVVLLALLTPALDKAIYQAELAKCGANLGGGASALNIYAASFKRSYPSRPTIGSAAMNTWQLSGTGVAVNWVTNLKGWLDVNRQFNDPMCGAIEIERSSAVSGVFAPYSYYAGGHFSHKNAMHQKGMARLGDRLEWHLDPANAPYAGGPRRYDLLLSDFAYTSAARNYGVGSHPDKTGVWAPYWIQDGGNRYNTTASAGVYQNNITASWWEGGVRGGTDLNFARSDGSVHRLVDVAFADDDRCDWLAGHWDNSYGWRVQVPAQ